LSTMRRPGRIDCRANGVRASPAIAVARTPATLELVETIRHCFWLAASARIAASRYFRLWRNWRSRLRAFRVCI
jgi:hypothetical protein